MNIVADYDWRNGEHVAEYLDKMLTDDAMVAVTKLSYEPRNIAEFSNNTIDNLVSIGAARINDKTVYLNAPVFMREDFAKLNQVKGVFGRDLATMIRESAA